jgi:uncharacterized protein YbjT (DUF2867 family)
MRFSIQQMFLTDSSGKPLGIRPPMAFHVVEAENLDAALSAFLSGQLASLVGTVLRLPGSQAVATAQQAQTIFTIDVTPTSDTFSRARRADEKRPADDSASSSRDSAGRR